MDHDTLKTTVQTLWDGPILSSLSELVSIPAVSPAFDADWQRNGHLDAAIEHVRAWAEERDLPGARIDVVQLDGRTPVLLIDIPATPGAEGAGTALLYGHLDKQPPVGGWSEGLGPWTPVVRDGRLYGRGSADDCYSGYAALGAVLAVRASGGAHGRCVVLLETGEESGSPDLPAYLDHLRPRLGEVSLVVCLDSGGADYERLWLTTSLRGMVAVEVTVQVLDSGQHSGIASGVVPSSFRVLRALLDRVEDAETGRIKLPELHVDIPEVRVKEATAAVAGLPGMVVGSFPFTPGVRAVSGDELELELNRTWRPTLSVIGADGLPTPADAGNVLRPSTTLMLSFRLPPTTDSEAALAAVRRALTTEVPYDAQVELSRVEHADGWNAPELSPWLSEALDRAGSEVFGQPWGALGMGGSIPFMGLLQDAYPHAQFVITGALGPDSNAHVPDESLRLDFAAKVTMAIAHLLDGHGKR